MDKKKLAAAMAAVFAHIKTSEEASAYHAQQEASADPQGPVQTVVQQIVQGNVWGISGRQTHMQANAMMQMRMLK